MSDMLKATTRVPEVPAMDLLKQKPIEAIDYELIHDRREKFTMELAHRFIEMQTFMGERKLNDRHMDFLLEQAKQGKFLGDITALASCQCVWDNTERRLNGQHTSWMRTYMPADWSPIVHVLKYRAMREEDFRALYASFDRIFVRSNKHVVTAELLGTSEFKELTSGVLSKLASGLRLWTAERARDVRSVDKIVELMRTKHYKLTIEVSQFLVGIQPSNAAHMYNRVPVVAAMFASFNKSSQDSHKFWVMVRDGGGDATHPAQALMKYLVKTTIRSDPSDHSRFVSVTGEEMYRVCITAWNAFRRGDKLKLLKVTNERVAAK